MFLPKWLCGLKAGLGYGTLVLALVNLIADSGIGRGQEPPPLDAPELDAPRTETSPPAPKAVTGQSGISDPTTTKPKVPASTSPAARNAPGTSSNPAKPSTSTPRARTVISQPVLSTPAPTPEVRPMLAIPGLTTPSPRPTGTLNRQPATNAEPTRSFSLPDDPTPALIPPAGMRPIGQRPSSTGRSTALGANPRGTGIIAPAPESAVPGAAADEGIRDSIPLGIEPLADDPPPASPPGRPGAAGLGGARTPAVRSTPAPLEDDPRIPSAIRRNMGRIQRYLGQPAASPPRGEGPLGPRPAEPETDATAKKRLEKELKVMLGDRVRSLEVRVSGRNVLVAAKPAWFWQRRGVKRSIETAPSLQQYRVRIDLED